MEQEIEAERQKQLMISKQADEMLKMRASIKQRSLKHKEMTADEDVMEAQIKFMEFENNLNDLIRTKGYHETNQISPAIQTRVLHFDDTLDRTLNPNFELTVNQ